MERNKQFEKVLFVINPISGDVDKGSLQEQITSYCREHGITASYFETTGQQDKRLLQRQLQEHPQDLLVAVGGDGTVHLAASLAIHITGLPLAILPQGSGNGLSKDLGIPQDPVMALQLLHEHTIRSIDTLQLNHRHCVHLADIGFNALIVKRFSEGASRGPGAYARVALEEYLAFLPKQYRIYTDQGDFEGEAFNITVTNANNYGSNATINPGGILNDGAFEICIIEPFPKAAGVALLYRLYNDTIDQSVYTRVLRCKRATIYNLQHELIQIDGEPVSLEEKIEVMLCRKSLRVLMPHSPQNMI